MSCTRDCHALELLSAALQPRVYRPASPDTPRPYLMHCRNIRQYPEAAEEAGLLLVRLDAPLYFANVQYVRDRLRKYELPLSGDLLRWQGMHTG